MGIFSAILQSFVVNFHVVRWGLVRNRTLLSRKWLRVIINDDFLEEVGVCVCVVCVCVGGGGGGEGGVME